jgi:hypothetical protein
MVAIMARNKKTRHTIKAWKALFDLGIIPLINMGSKGKLAHGNCPRRPHRKKAIATSNRGITISNHAMNIDIGF